jgi:hypothetical protein
LNSSRNHSPNNLSYVINNSQLSINYKYGLNTIDDEIDEYEFTLAQKAHPKIPKRTKNASVDLGANSRRDRIKIKKLGENSLDDINLSVIRKNRPVSALSTPMRKEKRRSNEEVKHTVEAMLERFKTKQDQAKQRLELLKLQKEEEQMSFIFDKPRIYSKNFMLPSDDFVTRQVIYKNEVDKKIQELKELQKQKLIEYEKTHPGYGIKIEEDDIQQKIDWLIKWKEQIIRRNIEKKKELMKKLMEECTFQPNINPNSKRILDDNLDRRVKIPPFERLSRGSSVPRKRNFSARGAETNIKNNGIGSKSKILINEKEEIKNLKNGLKKNNTKGIIKPVKQVLPPHTSKKVTPTIKKIKSNAPTIPSNSSSKKSLVSQDKKANDKNVLKNGIFDEKFVVNNITMSLVQSGNNNNNNNETNKSKGHPAGEISLKNKNFKVLPKLTDKDLEIMQDLFIQKMNGGDDK